MPYVDISLHGAQFWARSTASGEGKLSELFWAVLCMTVV